MVWRNICLISVFPLTLVFSGCRNINELQFTGIRGFSVQQISTAGLEGDLMVGLKNPNRLSFNVYPSEFDVKYSGVNLGKARLAKKVRIKGNTEQVYTFHIKSDFRNASLADIMQVLKGATFRNELELKGELRAGKLFYRKSLPVDFKDRISLK